MTARRPRGCGWQAGLVAAVLWLAACVGAPGADPAAALPVAGQPAAPAVPPESAAPDPQASAPITATPTLPPTATAAPAPEPTATIAPEPALLPAAFTAEQARRYLAGGEFYTAERLEQVLAGWVFRDGASGMMIVLSLEFLGSIRHALHGPAAVWYT
jgi:hypothetical protein